MNKPPAPAPERQENTGRRMLRKKARATASEPAAVGPGLVEQVRSIAGRLLDVSSAAGVAGRTLEAAGKVSRALWDGQAIEAAAEVLRVVLPSAAETAAWGRTGAAVRAMREHGKFVLVPGSR